MTTPEQAGTKPAEPSENDDLLGDMAALGLAFPSRSEQRQLIRRAGDFIRARLKTETDARFALLELAGEWAEECLQANEDKFSNAMQDRVNGAREKFLAALDRAALKPSPEPAVAEPKWKDHEIRELVNDVTKAARLYSDTQQLRARIVDALSPALAALKGATP